MIINTPAVVFDDNTIPDEPKIGASMGIIYNGPGVINNLTDPMNHFNGLCGIETRGNSTQGFDKKTYSVEIWNNLSMDTSVSLLGMGADEDWILHSMVIDKSQLRIPMTFDLARSMGHYAANWRYVEVVIDDEYRGLYLLLEKIKRDDDRVDISTLNPTDLTGDQVTGGYILRIDWLDDPEGFESGYNSQGGIPMFFQNYYPKATVIQPAQETYIESFMAQFEDALFSPTFGNGSGHYSNFADISTFTDFLITNEISKNSDGYKLSTYVHKDKNSNGGKLKAGPIWDFDQTYGMSTVCSCNDFTGWTYLQNQPECEDFETMPMWWQQMMSDPVFTNHLACRWETLRNGPLHLDSINTWIDEHAALISQPVDRNFQKWVGFIGQEIWSEPQPIPQTYAEEIMVMKAWIVNRFAWLDSNMPGICANDIVGIEPSASLKYIHAFPNPAETVIKVEAPDGSQLKLMNLSGKIVYENTMSTSLHQIDVSQLSSGMYILNVLNGFNSNQIKVIVN